MSGIEGKVIAITGASSGIGAATARVLAQRGAKLVLGARNREALQALANEIDASAESIAVLEMDVKRAEDLDRLVAVARERFGRLDVLISNAGVMPISPMEELRTDEWNEMIDVNIKGVLHGIASALPVFLEQGSGHFINVASTAGFKVTPTMAVYAGTKSAVRAISDGLRQEAGSRFRVTIVSPGITNTNFANHMSSEAIRDQLIKMRDQIAMPPEAIGRAIAHAIEQPDDVEVGEIVVRPTAQA